jgi:hypothetical protein|tara:strand:+ start:221 stop:589 length:369 start_codon:yes stop_codon:yes gene_type:complete
MKKIVIILLSLFALTSCGTIVNDANIPVSLSFSDGSDGECKLNNKRASYSVKIPSTTMIRRSDDALKFDCLTESGKKGFGSIPSGMEGGKVAASVFFFDLGITDAITDKSRNYPPSFVIPVN